MLWSLSIWNDLLSPIFCLRKIKFTQLLNPCPTDADVTDLTLFITLYMKYDWKLYFGLDSCEHTSALFTYLLSVGQCLLFVWDVLKLWML